MILVAQEPGIMQLAKTQLLTLPFQCIPTTPASHFNTAQPTARLAAPINHSAAMLQLAEPQSLARPPMATSLTLDLTSSMLHPPLARALVPPCMPHRFPALPPCPFTLSGEELVPLPRHLAPRPQAQAARVLFSAPPQARLDPAAP